MKTIQFTVHHGSINQTITGTGTTLADAIADLQRDPLGVGYAITPEGEMFERFICDLVATGQAQFGWGDYAVINAK